MRVFFLFADSPPCFAMMFAEIESRASASTSSVLLEDEDEVDVDVDELCECLDVWLDVAVAVVRAEKADVEVLGWVVDSVAVDGDTKGLKGLEVMVFVVGGKEDSGWEDVAGVVGVYEGTGRRGRGRFMIEPWLDPGEAGWLLAEVARGVALDVETGDGRIAAVLGTDGGVGVVIIPVVRDECEGSNSFCVMLEELVGKAPGIDRVTVSERPRLLGAAVAPGPAAVAL